MHTEKLISRIKAVLNGDSGNFEVQTLAIEYADLTMHVRDRLEQCAALIRAGNDFAALQIAESTPPLLDTAAQLSFLQSVQWIDLCRERNLPYPARLDQNCVDLASGLYGRQISESHPLYRDYRQAIRERNDLRALEVLAQILRVNPDDHNAQSEFVRLGEKTRETQLQKLSALLAAGNDTDAFALYDVLQRANLHGITLSPVFQKARARRENFEREQARREILATLAKVEPLNDTDDWETAVPLLARCRTLTQEYRVELTGETLEKMGFLENWAGEKQRVHAAKLAHQETLRQINNALIGVTSAPEPRRQISKVTLKNFAAELKMTLAAAAKFEGEIDAGLLDSARKILRRVNRRIQRREIVLTSAIALLLAACVSAGMFSYGYYSSTERRDEAVLQMNQLLENGELFPAEIFLQSLGDRWQGNDTFDAAHQNLATWTQENRARLDASIARATALQNMAPDSATPVSLRDAWIELREIEADLTNLPFDTREQTTGAILGANERLNIIQNKLAAEETPAFALRLDELEESFATAKSDPELKNRLDALNGLQPVLKKINSDGSALETVMEPALAARWKNLGAQILNDTAFCENAIRIENALAGATTLDAYLTLLRAESDTGNGTARRIVERAAMLKNPVDFLVTPVARPLWKFAEDLPAGGTTFLPEDLRPSESADAARLVPPETWQRLWRYQLRTFPADSTKSGVIYTIGQAQSMRTPVGEGYELNQRAKVLGENTDETKLFTYRQLTANNPRGEMLSDGKPAPESAFLTQFARFYNNDTGRIQEPLLITLDRVRNTYDISPLCKAYIVQEILKIAAARPADWGVSFSPRLKDDALALKLATQGNLAANDWLNPIRWNDKLPQLEKHFAPPQLSYMDEAQAYLSVFQAIAKPGFQFVGYINGTGDFQPATRHLLAGQLAVLTVNGTFVMRPVDQILESSIAENAVRGLKNKNFVAPYSPVLMLARTPEDAARITNFPDTATPPASGWSTLIFLPEYQN